MSDTNYFSGIVKILENSNQILLNNKILMAHFRAEIPQFHTNRVITLVFYGKLASEVTKQYQINDYILIEGYVSIQSRENRVLQNQFLKNIVITIQRIYPILLDLN